MWRAFCIVLIVTICPANADARDTITSCPPGFEFSKRLDKILYVI
jgi:hypothetical protein